MKEKLINLYPVSKTLQFSLIPVGKTEENFEKKLLLEQDEKRAEEYEVVKEYIDRYHKSFIESVLSSFGSSEVSTEFENLLHEYATLYRKANKSEEEKKECNNLEANMRKIIAKAFSKDERFNKLFKKELITELLPAFLSDSKELEITKKFESFTTYFVGFHQNRANMYSEQDQNTSIAHRCINDNLPKFLDNLASFEKIAGALPAAEMERVNNDMLQVFGYSVNDAFTLDFFLMVLSQSGIDVYNGMIGGYAQSDGTKVKGLNEYINLFNQQLGDVNKSQRLPKMKPLFKQILSDRESVSFIPEKFASDDALLNSINEFHHSTLMNILGKISNLFNDLASYDAKGIYITSGLAITNLSNSVFEKWNAIVDAWNQEYELRFPKDKVKNLEKYYEKERAEYKKNKSFSISELQLLGDATAEKSIVNYYIQTTQTYITEIYDKYDELKKAFSLRQNLKKLQSDVKYIGFIKQYLDAVKSLECLIKPLLGTGKEDDKDEVFYGEFNPLFSELSSIDRLYDKVRNYLTQKPYSKDKIKLNFENPQLLGGWDKNKERDYRTVLLRKDNLYYLAIMDRSNNKIFERIPKGNTADCFEKMNYKLLPGPNKMLPKVFFAEKNRGLYNPSDKIIRINNTKSYTKANFNLQDCRAYIDFLKESIEKNVDWANFGFNFSPTSSYEDIIAFYKEVREQGYQVSFCDVPVNYINELVDNGSLYLFQIYSKDFSEYSKGIPNLHTLYFRMLFDERNLANVVYQLNGGAEMFYRKASINDSEKVVHPANQPLENKNPDNERRQSQFAYDLIKDKRFTRRQFSLHVPITMNFKADGQKRLNFEVRKAIKEREHQYVIGIDRGERNLIYICVINELGQIVEQMSLNEIIGDNGYKVNYHSLLERKEADRDKAQKSWGTIENIKELKEGYMSQVVHKICELVLKYDAVIAMEDLNSGFMNSRVKVDKQVYQKFEKALTEKLNYLVDKSLSPETDGGLLHAYQLTNKSESGAHGIQDGIIFYIPAWNTSKIDPTTGFVDLLKPKYTSVHEAQKFISKFDKIWFDETQNMFAFKFKYSSFPQGCTAGDSTWCIYSNGQRIRQYRNSLKNNEWDYEVVELTKSFTDLFKKYDIDITSGLQEQIMNQQQADFFKTLFHLLALTLQMRNSISGRTDVDYIISPVKNAKGEFYCSSNADASLPIDADANGAYNIARKVLWAISVLKKSSDSELEKAKLSITNKEWLAYTMRSHE